MVKGKGKRRKQHSTVTAREDTDNDEKIPVRRRGRPLKLVKEYDDMNEEDKEESKKIEKEDDDVSVKSTVSRTDLKNPATKNKRKRKRDIDVGNTNSDMVANEENDIKEEDKADVMKTIGLKQIGSKRRKNKPHRAAEVGVNVLVRLGLVMFN